MTRARVLLCTCPDADAAASIARTLVGERLAACANIVPGIRSIYRWKGEVCDDPEVLLIIKTDAARVDALIERAVAVHPYDCPEVIALPVEAGFDPYLSWITDQTR